MRDHFDISGVFKTTEFEIAQVACTKIETDWHKNDKYSYNEVVFTY